MDVLLLFLHVSIVFFIFVMLHPQTYGNPFMGVYHFIEYGTQLVPPFNNIFTNAINIFFYQIMFLTDALRNGIPFNTNLCHFMDVIIFIVIIMGLLKIFTLHINKNQETLLRFIPLLLMVIALPIGFSSIVFETDARYTWALTIAISFMAFYGIYGIALTLVAIGKRSVSDVLKKNICSQ